MKGSKRSPTIIICEVTCCLKKGNEEADEESSCKTGLVLQKYFKVVNDEFVSSTSKTPYR